MGSELRTPPHSIEAEQALLGSMLLSPACVSGALQSLDSTDFYRTSHQLIFQAIAELHLQGTEVDQLSVAERLEQQGLIERVGGKHALLDLQPPTSANWSTYADIIVKKKKARQQIEAGTLIVANGYDEGDPSDALSIVMQMQDTGSKSTSLHSLLDRRIEQYKSPTPTLKVPGCDTTLHFGDFVTIAGAPGTGKTAFGLIHCALAWAQEYKCMFLSYEMDSEELADRVISKATGLSSDYAYEGLSDGEAAKFRERTEMFKKANLYIKEMAGATEANLVATMKAFAASGGKVVVLDYIQIAYDLTKSGENADITRLCKRIRMTAKQTGLLVVALSQFSRDGNTEGEQTRIVYPQMRHLRGSGSIEQDSAYVCLAFAYPDRRTKLGADAREALITHHNLLFAKDDPRDLIRFHWVKARHGKRGVIDYFLFDGSKMDFEVVHEAT